MSNSRETPPDRPRPWLRWGWIIARLWLVSYLAIVLLVSIAQRQLIYAPSRVPQVPINAAGFLPGAGEPVSITAQDGLQLHGWHFLPPPLTAVDAAGFDRRLQEGRKVVLFFPGNGGNRGDRDRDFRVLSNLNVHIFAFDYRGYGENPGHPTEEALAADARVIWKYITETRRVPADRIILYGESLGGGVATRLASDLCTAGTPPAGLILRSTFSSMIDAAGIHYPWLPVTLILKDRYRSDLRIPQMTAPLLMLHGTRDTIVPVTLGRKLFELAPAKSANDIAKTFVELPRADHNDVLDADPAEFRDGLRKFLAGLPK